MNFLKANPGKALESGDDEMPEGIAILSKTAEGVALQLPEDTTYDIDHTVDLITWDPIAENVTGSYVDTDADRIGAAKGYYRGVVK